MQRLHRRLSKREKWQTTFAPFRPQEVGAANQLLNNYYATNGDNAKGHHIESQIPVIL
jgi:hypothetical protein